MIPMNFDYDTAEIRRAARSVRSCGENVSNAKPKVRSVLSRVDGSFSGEAAKALTKRLENIDADINALNNGLNTLYRALNQFADAIEAADARMAQSMQ